MRFRMTAVNSDGIMDRSQAELRQFQVTGSAIIEAVIEPAQLSAIADHIQHLEIDSAGTRNLLDHHWCVALSEQLHTHPLLAHLFPQDQPSLAVQCTLFEKSATKNWLVPLHQDLSIPVAHRVENDDLQGWSQKEGRWFVRPPITLLEQLIILRLHIDACGTTDGPLKIVPGSHTAGRLSDADANALRLSHGELTCCVQDGGVHAMYPLTLHASSKASGTSRRRVLHFVYGPFELPCGLQWPAR